MSKTKQSANIRLQEYDGKYDNLTNGQLEAIKEYHEEQIYEIYKVLATRKPRF